MTAHKRPTEIQQEIFFHGNEGELAIFRAKILSRLLYEQLADISEGEAWNRARMDRVFVLLECLEGEVDGFEGSFEAFWKAARRAAHPGGLPEDQPAEPKGGAA
jgi:hypothetical protein